MTVKGTVALSVWWWASDNKENEERRGWTAKYSEAVNCRKEVGGKTGYVESELSKRQRSIKDIKKKISKKTKAIIVPHLYGYSCDLSKLLKLKKKYNVYLV